MEYERAKRIIIQVEHSHWPEYRRDEAERIRLVRTILATDGVYYPVIALGSGEKPEPYSLLTLEAESFTSGGYAQLWRVIR